VVAVTEVVASMAAVMEVAASMEAASVAVDFAEVGFAEADLVPTTADTVILTAMAAATTTTTAAAIWFVSA
jgi:hypothetical protein